ncbi:MAG: DMT family transporter [Rhodobacteraceae bacterium]|nr:DMT family transporter [Paracoccaceae bacterium]
MNPTFRAALWMTGAIASFSSMAVAGRELGAVHDTFEIMMYRSIVGVLLVSVLLSVRGKWAQVSTRSLGLHIVRNTVHFTGQNLWFFAVTAIPLAQVFAIEFTQPLWVILLSPLLLGERMTPVRVISALIGFVGILIVARPGATEIGPGVMAAGGCAIFFALTTIATKRLTRVAAVGGIMFWLTFMQAILGLAASAFDGAVALPTLQSLPWLVLVGLAGLVAHFCVTNALAIAPATVVIPMDFARLPTIAVVGMVLYNETVNVWILVGAVAIFAANYLNILAESRKFRVA